MKQKKGFFQDCLKDKKRAIYVAFFVFNFFEKRHYNRNKKEKIKNKK